MLPNYKDIVELLKKGSTIEAQEKIMELREAAVSLQEEVLELRQRLKNLEEQLALRAKVTWEPPYYWASEKDGKREGPYCQACYDKDEKLIRLQNENRGVWHCRVCGKYYHDKNYESPQIRRSHDPYSRRRI